MRKLVILAATAVTLVAFSAVSFAGEGCAAHKASAKTASSSSCTAKTASAKCCAGKTASSCTMSASACDHAKTAMKDVKVETTRMPSGALVVFYTSDKPEVVEAMQVNAQKGVEHFDCGVCQKVVDAQNCTVELAAMAGGVVAVVTSEDASAVDNFEKQFAALTAATIVN